MNKFHAMFLLICATTADLSNDCNDPNWHSLETLENARVECGPSFENRCYCLRTCYENRHQYVVNCTNSGFSDVTPLSHLPNETQVIILKMNVF